MQLNEILETYTLKEICKKTNISEENLEALFAGEFDLLKKVKTMGFISIIEREYNVDLSPLREEALTYYKMHSEDNGVVLESTSVVEKKKGHSKLFTSTIMVLLGVASWYFVTQFDQKQLRGWLPFNEEKMVGSIQAEVDSDPNLSIENAIAETVQDSKEKEGELIKKSSSVDVLAEENRTK
jgi:hypothetical protein